MILAEKTEVCSDNISLFSIFGHLFFKYLNRCPEMDENIVICKTPTTVRVLQNLVPDEVVIGMISSKLDNNSDASGFIFDGFPRTTAQAKALDNLLEKKETSISVMLSLKVEDEELIRRLLERGKNSGRTDDQDESIIANRINEYNNKSAPLKEFYSVQNKLSEVEGAGSIEDIAMKLNEVIDSL